MMAADGEALTGATIANPRLWRLGMLLDMEEHALTVAATPTVGEGDAICRRIELTPGVALLRALEDAVYDNPLLLADFGRCSILLRTPRYAVLPPEATETPEAAADAASLLWTDPDFSPALLTDTAAGASVLTACDADVAAFLGRTFADARVRHELSAGLRYFAAKAPRSGNAPKLFAVVEKSGAQLFCFDGSRLLGAASYGCTDAADMAYYAVAMAQACGVAGPELQFYVAGMPAVREAVAGTLRRFAPCVMPWIFQPSPSMAGVAADIPFSLLILPLCE